jgi:hypothetical protein
MIPKCIRDVFMVAMIITIMILTYAWVNTGTRPNLVYDVYGVDVNT